MPELFSVLRQCPWKAQSQQWVYEYLFAWQGMIRLKLEYWSRVDPYQLGATATRRKDFWKHFRGMRGFQMDSSVRGMLKLTVTLSLTGMLISHLWQTTETLPMPCLHPSISANIKPWTYRHFLVCTCLHIPTNIQGTSVIASNTQVKKACVKMRGKAMQYTW